jgi:hypothetical protein
MRSHKYFCRKISVIIGYSESVSVALVNPHAERVSRIKLSSVACPVLPCFCKLSQKRHDFRNKLLNTKCVF